ncbi:water-specific aquaporin-like protein, partial [Leptotrombidium deliense]
ALGCSANATLALSRARGIGQLVGPWAWGMALTAGIYISGGVSGGHLNPAVTLGMISVGKLHWKKMFHYIGAQFLGAFLGATVTLLVYHQSLEPKELEHASAFGTFPNNNINTGTVVIDQIVATAFFLLLINAITDERNMTLPKGLIPIAIGITDLGLMIYSFGYNCGAPLNPARDFSPRLLSVMAGWNTVFKENNYYFWVPLLCPIIGGVIGSWLYKLMIELHWPQNSYDLTTAKIDESENNSNSNKRVKPL